VSSTTWTPRAVASKAAESRLELWRAVEAQHVASTRRLVDSNAEQEALEDILEQTKPRAPKVAPDLHYLLATPFRYPPAGRGSRFRAPTDPGVFYGAEAQRSACAELGYWRWRFLSDSAGLDEIGPMPQTLFLVRVHGRAVDLRDKPFSRDAKLWTDPNNYAPTQAFATAARGADIALIRYRSVRDPQPGSCGAVLAPTAFTPPRRPVREQTWFLTVSRTTAAWRRDHESYEFAWR
jgi:hypothetical protein